MTGTMNGRRRFCAVCGPPCRRNPGCVVETVLPPLNKGHFGKLLDLDMLIFMGGKERTIEEFTELLSVKGFTLMRVVVPTVMQLSLIEAAAR